MNKTRWEKIENLYHAALERPPAERLEFLRHESGDDRELLSEVESLLNSAESDDSFMASPEFDIGLEILTKPDHVLKPGEEFGHYQVIGFIGRGGMGEVYLAEDTRLGRKVALKVLPADMAADQERIRRFIQEARAASALNHPNILTIHEIGESDGRRFIASEFVDGQNLRARLMSAEPLSAQGLIDIAVQIATALHAAHKVGIVHRDIKPENVMLLEDGLVKVLDFGLAKLVKAPGGGQAAAGFESTTPGMIMGTVAYMSPEQARGKKTDAQTDIWSLGVVLYEIVAGHLPFNGDTSSDIIAAILTVEPAPLRGKSLTAIPQGLKQIIERALHKEPARRYASAKEMADDLRSAAVTDESTLPTARLQHATDFHKIGASDPEFKSTAEVSAVPRPETVHSAGSARKIGLAVASVLALVSIAGFAGFSMLKNSGWFYTEPMNIARIFDSGKTISAAISPDGKYVAHSIKDAGKESLWIKHIATNSNVQLVPPDTAGFVTINFSRDGNYIYYVKGSPESPLYQVPVLGGDSKKILAKVMSSISFSPDGGEFAFVRKPSESESILMIAATDGTSERPLAKRNEPEQFSGYGVSWSPDGKLIAASVFPGNKLMNIALYPLDGGEGRMLSSQKWRSVEHLAWMPDGSGLIGTATGSEGEGLTQLWFFPIGGEDAQPVTRDLNQYMGVSLTEDADQLVTIHWQNRLNMWRLPGGRSEDAQIVSNNIHAQYRYISLGPDGRIVYPSNENANGNRDIWIMNTDGSGSKQLTSNAGGNILPCITSDGRFVVFASNRADGRTFNIWRMNMDGTEPVQITDLPGGARGPRCAPDATTVFFMSGGPDAGLVGTRLMRTTIDGGDAVQLTDYSIGAPDVSPDGRSIAVRFRLGDSGPFKLGILPVSGGKPEKVFDVNLSQNLFIRWKPDGQAVTFVKWENGVGNFWEQPIKGGPARPLTKFTAENILGFDWSRDGDLIVARGYEARDPVLISNFR